MVWAGVLAICAFGAGVFWAAAREIEAPFPKKWVCCMAAATLAIAVFDRRMYGTGTYALLKYLSLCVFLWVCAWTDRKRYLILNRVLWIALVSYFVWAVICLVAYRWEGLRQMLVGGAVAAGILAASAFLCRLVSPGSVGMGDIKLLMILGFYSDVAQAAGILIFAFLILFVVSAALLATRKANRKSVLPFAPFLLLGALAAAVLTGI